jgi:hypothetical protein
VPILESPPIIARTSVTVLPDGGQSGPTGEGAGTTEGVGVNSGGGVPVPGVAVARDAVGVTTTMLDGNTFNCSRATAASRKTIAAAAKANVKTPQGKRLFADRVIAASSIVDCWSPAHGGGGRARMGWARTITFT